MITEIIDLQIFLILLNLNLRFQYVGKNTNFSDNSGEFDEIELF